MGAQPVRESLGSRLNAVNQRIRSAERRFGRPPDSVALLAVSKSASAGNILEAVQCGQTRFGESYVQEALTKMGQIPAQFINGPFGKPIEWHFIGALQSNKAKAVARHFDWVHSVARADIAVRLSEHRPESLSPLSVCLQVNISADPRKSGVALRDLPSLTRAVAALPRLRLRGLMTLPAYCEDFEGQRLPFRALRQARDELQQRLGIALDTLSMGMSDDFEAAIAEGATIVRVGTAIFGPRSVLC